VVNSIALRTLPPEEIRMDPVGRDSIGNEYYFFPQFANDARVYRWNRRKDMYASAAVVFVCLCLSVRLIVPCGFGHCQILCRG
jgi:hypothetical protein